MGPESPYRSELKHEFVRAEPDPEKPWRETWVCENCLMKVDSPMGANFQEILKIATRCSETAVQEVLDF